MSDFPKWPKWMWTGAGEAKVFDRPEDVPEGWMTLEDYLALDPLDHDGDGRKGGSLKAPRRRRKPKE